MCTCMVYVCVCVRVCMLCVFTEETMNLKGSGGIQENLKGKIERCGSDVNALYMYDINPLKKNKNKNR